MRALLVITVLVLLGCAGTTPAVVETQRPSASADPSPPPVATPSPAPTPTLDPEALRTSAGKAYLEVAGAFNTKLTALVRKYPTLDSVKRTRAFYKAIGQLYGRFIAGLKDITFPADTETDARALIRALARVQAVASEGSRVTSMDNVDSIGTEGQRAARAFSAAANLVRADLDLPPVS